MNYVTQKNMKDILDGIKGKVPMGQFVSTQTASDSPLGTIIAYMGITPPDGFLACDGSTYNIADYTALATHIMNEFGSYNYFGGNGTTTFAVPDLRGEFLRGTGTNSHTNQGSGANVGVHQDGTKMPRIGVDNSGAIYSYPSNEWLTVTNMDFSMDSQGTYDKYNRTQSGSVIGASSYTSRPTNTSVLYCIKYTAGVSNQYSTTEQVVGQWIDGKPLYQITVDCGALPTNDIKTVSINTTNIKDIIDIQGVAHTDDGTNNSYWRNIPRIQDNNATLNTTVQINYEQNPPQVTILARTANNTNCDKSYITIKYTKVTD